MLKLYELLAKVGTNPKLRAWAMEQIINLKKLKSSYKKSFTHQMDLNRVKDVRNPNWLKEQIAKEKSYDLKNKVVDITKAKDKVRWNKIEKTQDKDKFYGVTGQVQTHLKKITDDIDDMFKKDDAHMAWFSKTLRNSLKGDKKATIEIDRYFANMEKTAREKVVPFWPRKKSFKTPPGKAEGGRIGFDDGGPSQKEIDKGIAAIEKLKSSLMPESYEALIEIYKDKQKDLNIDIMESAGGLGEMLGEGGRIGMMYGGDPGFAFSYGGSWADWKENHASEMPVMDYINQKLPKARNPFTDTKYQEGGEVTLSWEEVFKKYMNGETLTDDETVTLGQVPLDKKAEGGRIGMAKGDTPSEAYLRDLYYDGGWDNEYGLHEFMHGPIGANEWFKHNNKAEGGRIGFQEGTGIMSQTGIPYYADKALEGIVNSAETLSKLPFAAGKLGSQLLQSPPDKKMFSEAVENITPGSWSKNLGISSLAEAEGAKVSPKQKTIGNVLGLGAEIAVPVGGAFKIGQNLINQASKVFGKLKKGKTLDQTINDKITDFGQSRRDFNIVAGTSGLMVALKAIGLGGLFKAAPTKDFAVKLKTYFHNSDVDYGTSGMATFDLTALTAPVRTALKSIMNKAQKFKHGNYGEKLSGKEYINIDPGDAKFIVKELQKKGFTGKFTGIADEGGDVLKQAEKAGQKDFVKTYKKQSMKQNVKDHQLYNDYVVYENDPGFLHWNEATKGKLNKPFVSTIDEVVEILEPVVKKGEGGIIEDDEFREFLDDRKNRDKDNFQRDFFEDFKKWKKWKEGNIQEAKDGGRMWQPKSAPQLTTTIPPESGPMPHGLTYLTGDDIVQNIGHKHGRN